MPGPIGNKHAQIHGGAAAEKALTTGADFTGLAAITEREVTAELERDGISSIVKRNAVRMQTVADLYYQAILGAKDLDALDSLVKRYGWIVSSTQRAWQQVREEQKGRDRVDVVDVLASIKGADNDG